MRNAAGQQSQTLQFLCLLQLVFEFLALAYIADIKLDRLAVAFRVNVRDDFRVQLGALAVSQNKIVKTGDALIADLLQRRSHGWHVLHGLGFPKMSGPPDSFAGYPNRRST